MIVFEDFVVSDQIVSEKFVCDLSKCKGACCILGDTGAPLDEYELSILDDIFEDIVDYLPDVCIKAIETQGKYVQDNLGNFATPLVNGKQCAYVFFDNQGIAKCAIEKAFFDGIISFRKPASCHLYPIRVNKFAYHKGLNFHEWEICKDARRLGKKNNTPIYKFLKEPIIQYFGKDLYDVLSKVKL